MAVAGRYKKWNDLLLFAIVLLAADIAVVLSSMYYMRWDLTEEKKYTLHTSTRALMESLDDVVYVEVYLDGDMPAGFKRLKTGVRENLDEFKAIAGSRLQYKFIDPLADSDPAGRQRTLGQLARLGMSATNIFDREGDKKIEKLVVPYAMIHYRERQTPVLLLNGNSQDSPQERLNQSIENVEFELANGIKQLAFTDKKNVAYLVGNGQPDGSDVADLFSSAREHFFFSKTELSTVPNLYPFDAVVIARPQTKFTEADAQKIDDYVLKGGRLFLLWDAMRLETDTNSRTGIFAYPYESGLEEIFFKYGFRFNHEYIKDLNAGVTLLDVAGAGKPPKYELMPWLYYPYISHFGTHPIVKNMDALSMKFCGAVDTVKAEGIARTPLLLTSPHTRSIKGPLEINFDEARAQPNPADFQSGTKVMGWLFEGQFTSLFKNRIGNNSTSNNSLPGKIVAVGDGDMVRNEFNAQTGVATPLGLDKFTGKQFANKAFILNVLEYLTEDDGLIMARTKSVTLRPLNKNKIREEKLFWQIINIAVPVLLLWVFAVLRYYLRKKKYELS